MNFSAKSHFARLIKSLHKVMEDSQLAPDELVRSILHCWCKDSFPKIHQSDLLVNTKLLSHQAIDAFVDFVKNQDFLEATYWLSSAYAQLVSRDIRKQMAMYFTPPSLVRRVLDDLSTSGVDFAVRKFCDPACGGAAFLVPIAIRIRDELKKRGTNPRLILEHMQKHLLGFDKDYALCELSKNFLLMVLYDEIVVTGKIPNFQIYQCDSLQKTEYLFGTLDVVVCNPPFRKVPLSEVAHYGNRFVEVIEGQPNLYALFMTLCIKLISSKGICALVTPTSFLSGRSFTKLRAFITQQTKVVGIGIVCDRSGVFIDVEQETAITLISRENDNLTYSKETNVSVIARNGHYIDVGKCVLPNSGSVWPIPRNESDVDLISNASKSNITLIDYGYLPRIGAFVWNRDKRKTYPSLKKAEQDQNGVAIPLLWASDISLDGQLNFTGSAKANQEHCFVNMGSKGHCSVICRPSVLLQRVTSNDQQRRLIAAVVPSTLLERYGGFVGENHTVILEQVTAEPEISPEQLVELLSTPIVDRYFRCISGANNVSIFELNQLRLPDPKRLKYFLAQGKDMLKAVHQAFQ
ncbi:N-6 DNA methylase [Vibrio cholerae]|uniref:HsdM family class I SAM-dependent methyltransferase n=1 Tax=Vibrio cholerae TaxID=666 RepID=UPI0011591AA5|nr:N-6 DNA methylase [Vibrio cholerae]ELE2134429.1 N-6 DNA methylase [Vibrio cholerae]MCD1170019.1 N-6 DNA methylase [Vibrio cholerae]TQP24088.1 N-6 DNA methylase [Vibrio cholerae]HDZ9243941.1 N-6 DNA methylase [Vibrio cholerae]HDZ9465557.1 N-6 DNA methylase [Vibrio cholerae]